MEDKDFSPEQSLKIIQSMIGTAKNSLADNSFYYIFWGWLVFACAIVNYIAIKMNFAEGYMVWALMPLGAVISIGYSVKQKHKEKVRTYVSEFMGSLWSGVGLAIAITIALSGIYGLKSSYFTLMLLYGIGTFVAGSALKFNPLKYGSMFSFAAAIAATFSPEAEAFLWLSVALLFSYIIPGHMLKSQFNKQNRNQPDVQRA